MIVLLRLLGLCALLLALPAHAAKDPLAQGTEDHEAQVIGWSADEQRFALRLYLRDATHIERKDGENVACEGYVTHEGHPLRGGLVLLAYERGRLLSSFTIYDLEKCTPADVSKKRLEDAKKKLSALGINLETPGREFIPLHNGPAVTITQGPQAPYVLEHEKRLQNKVVNRKAAEERGTAEQELYMRKGDARQKLLTRKVSYSYSTRMTGYWEAGLERVFASPSGKTLVVLGNEVTGSMARRRKSLRLLGVLGWSEDVLKPL